jgi:predicted nucleic acid-binding protein
MIYFDTAYLLKCCLPESGHVHVRNLILQQRSACCCNIGRIEFLTGLRRASREGRLPAKAIATVLSILKSDEQAGVWIWLPHSPQLIDQAWRLIRSLPSEVTIRAGDALHLACAREAGCSQLFTNDRQMLLAAPHFGVAAANVIP